MPGNGSEERVRCNVKAGAQILLAVIATTLGALYANVRYFHQSWRSDLPLILALNVGAIIASYINLRRNDIVFRETELVGPSPLIGRTTIPYKSIRNMRPPSLWRSGYIEDLHGSRVILCGHHFSNKEIRVIAEKLSRQRGSAESPGNGARNPEAEGAKGQRGR